MCGRFTLTLEESELFEHFDIANERPEPYTKRYNIAPGQNVLAVVHDGQAQRIGYLRWGLVPYWAKEASIGYKMINARSETVTEKPSFRHAFRRQRCLIPADGFFEWKKNTNGKKQPYRFVPKERRLFNFAGLWDRWVSNDGETVHTCTILTAPANSFMAPFHHRMPVILPHASESKWLDRRIDDPQKLKALILEAIDRAPSLHTYAVSTAVNAARNDSASLLQPLHTPE